MPDCTRGGCHNCSDTCLAFGITLRITKRPSGHGFTFLARAVAAHRKQVNIAGRSDPCKRKGPEERSIKHDNA
jgi:hypothetical protein